LLTYWRFYWPLALTSVGMVLSMQFQNATLARYPEAVRELAVLALAYSVFGFFNACLQFIAQLTNVYARSPQANRRTWRFVVMASVAIMLPLLSIATTSAGNHFIQSTFSIEAQLADNVTTYLLLMCPIVLLNGQRHYLTGLMIQARRTGWVTLCNFAYLGCVVVVLVVGFTNRWAPVHVIVGAEAFGLTVLIGLLLIAKAIAYLPPEPEHQSVSYRELLNFFIPVSTTGIMFALSRPVLFAFVARSPGGLTAIAALRIAFDFSTLFQQAANQFRHFFISLGFDDLAAKKRFMAIIAAGLTAIMGLIALTPLSAWIWGDLMGVPNELIEPAVDVLLVMCLIPVVIVYRNYFHGRLMHLRRTAGMAYGSMSRVVVILVLAAMAYDMGALTHTTAAVVLIVGFVVETAVAQRTYLALKKATPDG